MFVEEGFRIRFANGEVIDFYADKTADKEGWMKVLSEVVGKESAQSGKSWTATVLKRERALASRALQSGSSANASSPNKNSSSSSFFSSAAPVQSPTTTSFSRPFVPQSPRPSSALDKPLPYGPTPSRDPRKMTPAERREKAKTMLF